MAPKGVFVRTAECNRINSESKKKSYAEGRINANLGKQFTQEHKDKIAEAVSGKNNGKWEGGKTKECLRIRMIFQHKTFRWKQKILFRDNFICQNTNCPHCKNIKSLNLEAHHIKSFLYFPELRFNIDNGITVCKKYHSFLHSKENISEDVYHASKPIIP